MINKLSSAGSRHMLKKEENQDAISFGENKRYAVITLADGVSSCKNARAGAEIASQSVTDLYLKKADYFLEFEREDIAEFTIDHILYDLKHRADAEKLVLEDYSSTIASVIYDKEEDRILFLNLGDSLIITVQKEKCNLLSTPQDSSFGCPVTTTKGASIVTEADVIDAKAIESVIICSDGAWSCMYEKGCLKTVIRHFLLNGRFDELGEYLKTQNCTDDYSFIAIDLKNVRGIAR